MRPPIRTACMALGFLIGSLTFIGAADAQIKINEIRTDNTGADTDEYFELIGPPGTSLSGFTYIVIGDSPGGLCGVIESVTNLSAFSIQPDGLLCLRNSADTPVLTGYDGSVALTFENSDNVTHMLVSGFTGSNGQDLDTNDDGVLDVTPWTTVVDCIGLNKGTTPNCAAGEEYLYCGTTIGPDGSFVPGHVYRCSDTMAWKIGAFSPLGTNDTPGSPNPTCGVSPPTFQNLLRDPCVPQTAQAATVTAEVQNADHADLHYAVNGGSDNVVAMTLVGSAFQASIPGQGTDGTKVAYYVNAFNAAPNPAKSLDQGYFVGTTKIVDLRVNDGAGTNVYNSFGARVQGNVTVAYGVLSTANTDYYVQDDTGGINVFKLGTHMIQPAMGDDITVEGTLSQFSGKLEITKASPCDSVFVTNHGSGRAPYAKLVTTCDLGEDDEGMLVQLNRLNIITGGDAQFGSNKDYKSFNCDPPDSANLFIDSATDIPGSPITTTMANVYGIAGQFDASSPYTSGYEVRPRSRSDLTFLNPSAGLGDAPALGLALMPGSPNPFSEAAAIRYRIPASLTSDGHVRVRLRVFDLRGRVVATLVDGLEEAGEHVVRLERRSVQDAGSGIYFYRLEVPGRTLMSRVAFVR